MMGRRNIHATKTGKFMNPTDQARKLARKRELKKNKKQRMVVRQAVLKSKDVFQLLEEAVYYDKQEFDPNVRRTLNDRVIQEKRKKILETIDRLINLYRREDSEYAAKIISAKNEYEIKRNELVMYYEQVKLAESVKTSEIPLPDLPQDDGSGCTPQVPLPPVLPPGLTLPPSFMMTSQTPASQQTATKGILKNTHSDSKVSFGIPRRPPPDRAPPGPPPGPPVELSDSDDEEANNTRDGDTGRKRIRFADDSEPVPVSGTSQNLSQLGRIRFRSGFRHDGMPSYMGDSNFPQSSSLPSLPNVTGPPDVAPFQPSMALRAMMGGSTYSSQLQSNVPLNTIPLPSGPVPPISVANRLQFSGTILSAPPNLKLGPMKFGHLSNANIHPSASSVIEAKPKLKNLIGDATRLVPTSVRVKRTMKDSRGNIVSMGGGASKGKPEIGAMYDPSHAARAEKVATKDSAYEEFMKEIDGLL